MIEQTWICPSCKDEVVYHGEHIYAEVFCTKCGIRRVHTISN